MAETALKVRIRFRWWVMPVVHAAIVPAIFIDVFGGRSRCDAFVARVGRFIARHGIRTD